MSAPQPDLGTDLSARQWRWLVDQVGEPAALRALAAAVAAGRRPYPLNAARVLRLRLPVADALPRLPGPPLTYEQVQAHRARLDVLRAEMVAGTLAAVRRNSAPRAD